MNVLAVAGIIAGLIALVAYVPYIRDIRRGTTKPVRATWFIWMVLSGIALSSQLASRGHWSVVMTAVQTIGVTVIFVLSLKRGYGGLGKKEIVSLIIAALGLVLWAITNKPLIALLCVVVVDAAGSWLTIFKAYNDPSSETISTWVIDSISSIFALIAVGSLNYTLLLYPGYLLIANGAVMVALLIANRS